jgi:hypothetical protein
MFISCDSLSRFHKILSSIKPARIISMRTNCKQNVKIAQIITNTIIGGKLYV